PDSFNGAVRCEKRYSWRCLRDEYPAIQSHGCRIRLTELARALAEPSNDGINRAICREDTKSPGMTIDHEQSPVRQNVEVADTDQWVGIALLEFNSADLCEDLLERRVRGSIRIKGACRAQ